MILGWIRAYLKAEMKRKIDRAQVWQKNKIGS
jgi:hypothetical protein